jgi:hypothetical protein
MIYLALGCAALLAFLWLGRSGAVLKRSEWRVATGAAAIALLTAAAYVGMRGNWGGAIVLGFIGLALAASSRRTTGTRAPPRAPAGAMSLQDARSILGVGEGASRKEIQEAYSRLMRMAHPDKGGTDGLAAQLNAARDKLLGR